MFQSFKRNCQAFELIVDESLSLGETFLFLFPIVSITTPDGKLRRLERTFFRNCINKESEALHTIPPEDTTWFIDCMALIRCLKPKKLIKNGFWH